MTTPKRSKSCSRAACPPRSSTRWPTKLEAFIARHGHARVLEIVKDFEGMDAIAFWHDIKFSLRHVKDFSRVAIVCNPDTHHLWSSLVSPFMGCEVEHFSPGEVEAARDWLMWPEGAAD